MTNTVAESEVAGRSESTGAAFQGATTELPSARPVTSASQQVSKTEGTATRSLWRRCLDLAFGYDFFISYSWSDGGVYAAALARQLRSHGFEVFLDRDDYASGDDWKQVGAWKLRRTGQLVLIGSPKALLSAPVIREVRIFSGTGRRIVPIDFDGTLEWKSNDVPLAQYLLPEILRIRESTVALEIGPSDDVVATIRRSFNLVRQDKKRVNALAIVALLLGALTLAAFWQSVQATRARHSAEEQRDRAQRVLDQITASANSRVMAYAERAQAESRTRDEIANIGGLTVGISPNVSRAAELIKLSNGYFDSRDFGATIKAAQAALTLLGNLDDGSHPRPDNRLMKANGYERIGLAEAQFGRFKEAAKDLATSLELIQGLASESPQDAELRERMAVAHVNMGDICVEMQEFEDAEDHFKEAIALRLAAADMQTSLEVTRWVAAVHNRLANLKVAQQQYDAAVEASEVSISILERLRGEKPDNRVLRDLAAAYDIRAKALYAAGKLSLALAWREKDFAIIKQLTAGDPDSIEWQHDLAINLDTRGQILEKLGQNGEALEAYSEAIAIDEALKGRDGVPPEWLRDTAGTLGHYGVLLRRLGRTAEAVGAFRRRLAILEQLASSYPDIISYRLIEDAYRRAREALLEANRWAEALETAEQQLFSISLAADRETRDLNRLAEVLSSLCWTALLARNIQRAELAGQQAYALAPGLQGVRLNYAHSLMYSGSSELARKIYLDGLSAGNEQAAKWRKMVHDDFVYLSARNLQHPLMAEIEQEIRQ
jgi:tetratricopeptide (TPR) repeat protein